MKGLHMNNLKENEKERTKERVRENQPPQQPRLRHARTSVICDGCLTAGDVYVAASKIDGMTQEEACDWIEYMEEVGWVFANGAPVNNRNFRRSLRMWHKSEARVAALRRGEAMVVRMRHRATRFGGLGKDIEEMERIKAKIAADKHAKAMAADDAWILCKERCAEFNAGGCVQCKHWSVPPQLRERPIPPEECCWFVGKAGK